MLYCHYGNLECNKDGNNLSTTTGCQPLPPSRASLLNKSKYQYVDRMEKIKLFVAIDWASIDRQKNLTKLKMHKRQFQHALLLLFTFDVIITSRSAGIISRVLHE